MFLAFDFSFEIVLKFDIKKFVFGCSDLSVLMLCFLQDAPLIINRNIVVNSGRYRTGVDPL